MGATRLFWRSLSIQLVIIIIRDTQAQCGVSGSVCKINDGAGLEMSLEPSLYHPYQSFSDVSINRFIQWSPLHLHGRVHTRKALETSWPAMHTFLSFTMTHVIVRLRIDSQA